METVRTTVNRVSFRELGVLAAAAIFLASLMFIQGGRMPIVSAEMRFVEHSTGGLQIVPASCPSNPHAFGECSVVCSMTASPSVVAPGGAVTLSWNTPWDTPGGGWVEINNGVGRKPSEGTQSHVAGSVVVNPTQTTTYVAERYEMSPQANFWSLLEKYGVSSGRSQTSAGGSVRLGSCQVAVTVQTGQPPCPSGTTWNGSQCVPPEVPGCPPGSLCVPPEDSSCPNGYLEQGIACVFVGCPTGYTLQAGRCVPQVNPQCTPAFFCVGSSLWERDAQCVESGPVQTCVFGCNGEGCLAAPPGEGDIIVKPALIRTGERTTVAWETSDMVEDSCIVVENNPEISDVGEGPSGSFLSSVIHQQTSYTLMCERENGDQFVDSATVNVIPVFEED